MKIKRVFKKQIRGKDDYEIENKAKEIFRDIIFELDKEGICIFETPETPAYYQKRRFLLKGGIYASIEKDLIRRTCSLTVEYFHPSVEYFCSSTVFFYTLDKLESLVRKHSLKELIFKK